VRQKVARLVEDVNRQLQVADAHMHMHPENQQPSGDVLHVLFEGFVAQARGDGLLHPARKRVRARRHDALALRFGDLDQRAP
jgi:hypothetical protein